MRKYFLGIMAVIIAISLSSFSSIKKDHPGSAISLYWFEYNAITEETGIYVGFGERDDFKYGACHVISGPDCRRGFPLTALQDQTDPSSGVIDDEMFEQRIRKHVSF